MKYVTLMTGKGGTGNGCGHYFSCNMGFKIIEAETDELAAQKAAETWEYYSGDQNLEKFQCFRLDKELELVLESVAVRRQREQDEYNLERAEREVAALRVRLGKQ